MLKAAWLFARSPARAARGSPKNRLDLNCLWLYLLATAAFMLLFWLKPFDFPDRTAPIPYEMQDFAYWLKAELWQPVLEGGWVVFMLGLLQFFASGTWPVKLATAVLLTASPFILIGAYAQMHAFPYWAFAAGCSVWLVPFYYLTAKAGPQRWWPLINFSLGVNAIGLPIAGLLSIAALLDQAEAFKAVQIAGGLWLLGATTLGVRELSGLRLPRAFMAVILSAFMQFALAFCLHFLGAKGVLKALFYG
ncbi:MAG: hypothetical protein HY077_10625 [Elusimicrobia bacterium]|nr:hypothetical protein [Elusimicrobiota bacterium]